MGRFCRGKCHKHFKMKHNPRRMKWTKAYRRAHGKEMMLDSTFNFEKKRLTPVRYNRNLMVKTVQAMQKIENIRNVRKERFAKQRLAQQFLKRQTSAQEEFAEKAKVKAKRKVKVERSKGSAAMDTEE